MRILHAPAQACTTLLAGKNWKNEALDGTGMRTRAAQGGGGTGAGFGTTIGMGLQYFTFTVVYVPSLDTSRNVILHCYPRL